MKPLPPFGFRFTRIQKAVLLFLALILILQLIAFFGFQRQRIEVGFVENKALQEKWDRSKQENRSTIYPFNHNFISSYKDYQLDLSAAEYQAIVAWRQENNYFTSIAEFQAVTKVSAAWLSIYGPYFKWSSNKEKPAKKINTPALLGELNTATASDFQKIRGVGTVLSERILKYKKRLGGFALYDQLHEVYGLDATVVNRLEDQFTLNAVSYSKINLQTASLYDLTALPYLNHKEAKEVLKLRTTNDILSLKGLKHSLKWDPLKFQRLTLYLY